MKTIEFLKPMLDNALVFPVMPNDDLSGLGLEDADRTVTRGTLIYGCLGLDEGTQVAFPAGCESAFREDVPGEWRPLAFLEDRLPGDVLIIPAEKVLASFGDGV